MNYSKHNNFKKIDNKIKYEFLFRTNAKNTSNYVQDKDLISLLAIEIFNKFLSQTIKRDNTFINNLYVRDMLNKVLYDNNVSNDQRILFSNLVDMNLDILKSLKDYEKALLKFNLSLNKIGNVDFVQNNNDGIFYGVAIISNWLFDDEKDTDEVHGDFTKEFLEKMNNDKDISYIYSSGRQGYFLVQMKTNKTSNVEKFSNEIPSINDDLIGDYIPNQNGTSTITYKKELDLYKEISYNFINFEFEHGLYNELWNGQRPDTLQEMRKVIWNTSLNSSNEKTNKSLIVSRIDTGETQHKLNDLGEKIWDNTTMDWAIEPIYNYIINYQYKDNFVVTDDEYFINTNTIVGNYSLKNSNDEKTFTYKFKIGKIINMYKKYSLSDDFKDDFNNNWNPIKIALEKATFSEIKNSKVENKNNYSSKNNSLALAIPLPIIIGIMIASIATFVIIKRKKSKKI